jgi:hypothetical protein
MTSVERMYALCQACRYLERHSIAGDFVECGVWRGGSAMMAALTLADAGSTDRQLWLYDTFEGMPEPESIDVSVVGLNAEEAWRRRDAWCLSPLEEVQANMAATGYPTDRVRFVKGKVEDTVPATVPDKIALLRLDTDWFASTYHELVHLVPRLVDGGVLIIDDYGHWKGCREATDRYLAETGLPLLLQRIDRAGYMGVHRKLTA